MIGNIAWPATTHPIELLWTIVNLVGALRWLQRYALSVRQRAAISQDDARLAPERVVADIRCIRSVMKFDCLFAFTALGLIAMTLPTPPVRQVPELLGLTIAALMFFVALAIIVTGELFDRMEESVAELLREYQRLVRERRE